MPDTGSKSRTARLAMGVVLAILLALAVWAVTSRRAELAEAPRFEGTPVAVHTLIAEAGDLKRTRRYLAEAEAVLAAEVSARVTETVTEVAVDEGDRVAAGDVLVRLESSKVVARLQGVAADLDQVRAEREAERAREAALAHSADYWTREVERLRQLREQQAISQSELDAAVNQLQEVRGNLEASRQQVEALAARLESLRARRTELRSQRADYTLNAPFAGTVTARAVDPGDQAAPGRALVRVSSTERMRLAFGVPESDRPELAAGRKVLFELGGEPREAAIDRIHPALDARRLARAEVDLPAGLAPPPGAELAINVVLPPVEGSVLIPAGALAGGGERPSVYLVADGKAEARPVTVNGRDGDQVAVSGIEPGATVVTSPYLGWTRLADGMPVTQVRP